MPDEWINAHVIGGFIIEKWSNRLKGAHTMLNIVFWLRLVRWVLSAGIVVMALIAFTAVAPRYAVAKPEFAAQTKLPCGQCHANPAGGGALKPFGQKFKANGFKLK